MIRRMKKSNIPFTFYYLPVSENIDSLHLKSNKAIILYSLENISFSISEYHNVILSSMFEMAHRKQSPVILKIKNLFDLELTSEETIQFLQDLSRFEICLDCQTPKIVPAIIEIDNFIASLSVSQIE